VPKLSKIAKPDFVLDVKALKPKKVTEVPMSPKYKAANPETPKARTAKYKKGLVDAQ